MKDILDRYPFEPAWAERQLRRWAESGRVVAVPQADGEPAQFSAPANLEQVQRGSLGLLRREVTTCPAQQFVDFLLRWQHAHPSARRGTADGLAEVLARLQGLALPAGLWERAVLPARVPGYQPRWLDEWIGGGAGAWVARGDTAGSAGVAFFQRDELAEFPPPADGESPPEGASSQVLECLRQRGALFVSDLAATTGLPPGAVRAALWDLAGRSLVANDRFDVVRRGREEGSVTASEGGRGRPRPSLTSLRRRVTQRPEGRWSVVPWGAVCEPEARAVLLASRLLYRYGIVARELALPDPWMSPWRVLYEVLSRMELVGEVRRGYFVEGLSGAQFALPEAARMLQELQLPSAAGEPVILLHSLDPANLYGSGAPLDVALLDGGTRPFVRRSGNWLVVRAGRPVLLIEQQGKRLTALASASREDVRAAVGLLPGLCEGGSLRHKLAVEEWNGRPVTTTEGRELLEEAGFVRDYQGMTLYAAWR